MLTSKTVIIDSLTNEFYCTPATAKDYYGNPTTGDADFPFWSTDINDAVDFKSTALAEHETAMNDLTEGSVRNPVIVTV